MQNYQYFEWGSTLNTLDGFKIIIFQCIICEPFRSWKEGLAKLDVNVWEIWRKYKCRRSMSLPPLLTGKYFFSSGVLFSFNLQLKIHHQIKHQNGSHKILPWLARIRGGGIWGEGQGIASQKVFGIFTMNRCNLMNTFSEILTIRTLAGWRGEIFGYSPLVRRSANPKVYHLNFT